MVSVNEKGLYIIDEMLDWEEELKVESQELENGAIVIDCGVNAEGGYDAGMYLSRLCLADLADINYTKFDLNGIPVPAIQVATDLPTIACMASQYAGWRISVGKYFGMGSGPARSLGLKPKELYEEIDYKDDFSAAVLVMESNKIPNEEVVEYIAKHCSVDPENVFIAVAPTASIAGSVQISARVVETGIHKLESIGFDINSIKSGFGVAPIAPIVGDDTKCMGSTNDCVIYCGETYYTVEYEDTEKLKDFVQKTPSVTSKDYGKPFYTTFKEADFDFFKVDAGMFAPAKITVNDLASQKTFTSGKINPDILLESFGIESL
ncbi:methenyltetrahydromethanopterin cyclohydrolase [Methanosalsum zhilinae DSM 4017]|uniref:Methenyltetrahydromethanopterin cyclohydrolase n=1 Tax=Methanosalsum zhilinae (strain DSM 4017 / NBRC 107636 / OCM 62 / WeN5) TaxID=679901 RepID=F7XNE3_METZD|nr:methenyltetrahydromethanopterin cyclohydrolase [Methanosalsum zhilinae]AEH61193.1 methenyltetrahydromethanopterin cyclohydrolase [Methanosalsum zhilinae DSM 4017]